jgi:hypothetical protein
MSEMDSRLPKILAKPFIYPSQDRKGQKRKKKEEKDKIR